MIESNRLLKFRRLRASSRLIFGGQVSIQEEQHLSGSNLNAFQKLPGLDDLGTSDNKTVSQEY